MGFKPMSYEDVRDGIIKQSSLNSPGPDPNEPLRDWPDPRGQPEPPWPPDRNVMVEAVRKLAKECEEIKARRREETLSGNLEDIRERLAHG